MILFQDREYYPLDFGKMIKDEKVYYDRSSRKKNYFYLDLRTEERPVYNLSTVLNEGDE